MDHHTAIVLISAIGCVLVVFAPFLRSTNSFVPFAGDARVHYEVGAEIAAATIARALPDAIAAVERGQFSQFAKPVEVYVCANTATFERYGHHVAGAGGFVLNGRLFISPKVQNTAERLPRLLVHELSHLHLDQQLGTLGLARRVPNWFKEGLAVYVSVGGGAENVSETQARESILAGRFFRRDVKGSLLAPQTGARDGLPAHMFYRQSAMFVEFLAGRDRAFERLMAGIQDRQEFSAAVVTTYGTDIETLWQEFSNRLRANSVSCGSWLRGFLIQPSWPFLQSEFSMKQTNHTNGLPWGMRGIGPITIECSLRPKAQQAARKLEATS